MSSAIDINGNTLTQDKVVRREFRLAEGDAFNGFQVKRSRDRIQSLGYFQDKFEIEQKPGSRARPGHPRGQRRGKADRPAPAVGGLFEPREVHRPGLDRAEQLPRQGPDDRAPAAKLFGLFESRSSIGFTEPYLFDKNIVARRRHLPPRLSISFNFIGDQPQHDLSAGDHRLPDPRRRAADRIRQLAGRAATRSTTTTSRSIRRRIYHQRRSCDPILAGPLSVRRDRQAAEFDRRRLADLRHARQPGASDRAAASLQPRRRFRGAGRRRQIRAPQRQGRRSTGRSARASCSRSRPKAARSRRSATTAPMPGEDRGPADRPLLPRRAADPRLRHPRRGPARGAQVATRPIPTAPRHSESTDRKQWVG